MTANMNFGPEWMRGGLPQRSNTMDSHSSQSASTLSSSKEYEHFGGDDTIGAQDVNIFKYSRDFMLSLYRPMDPPAQFEKLTYVAVEEPIRPLAFVDLTDDEKKLLSGPVHVEPTRRMANVKEAGNGQRFHRGPDHYSADNGSGRPINRVKGRQGLEHRREASTESGGMKNGDGQNDGNGYNNKSNSNNTWGNRDAFGSWGDSLNGDGGLTSDTKDTVPLSWSQSSGSGDNGTGFKSDMDPSSVGGSALSDDLSSSTDKHPSQYKWYYRDPANNLQGPFGAQEMQDWYKAGFFGPSLWIRREDQEQFEPLAAMIVKIGSEDVFMSPMPVKKPVGDPLAGMSSFRPVSDPFGRVGSSGPLFGGGVSSPGLNSPGLNSPGGLFGTNQTSDILSPGLGKYSPFGNHLNQGPGSNPGTPSLPLASPFGNNDSNVFSTPFLGRDSGSPWSERPATPSWLNNSQSDLFGSTFQRQSQPLHSPFYQQNQQQQHMQPMMNPLFQQQRDAMRGLGGETMDSQQQFAQMLQQRQNAMGNQPFQLQQDLPSLHDQPNQQHNLGQNQVLGQLSSHASPVIRPAALNGWCSSPGTPLATEAPSSPWGSIISPAIPQLVSEELQAKAPGQQSPRSHMSPQVQHASLPSAPPKVANSPPPAATEPTNVQERSKPDQSVIPPTIETLKTSLNKVSLHDIQQEQENQRKQKEEMLRRQLEKEESQRRQLEKEQQAAALMAQKKMEAAQQANTTKEKPSVPQAITPKKVSLLDIQQEEMKKQQEIKKQAKANNKMAMAAAMQQEQANANATKSGWTANASGWANDSYKGPSLREIQEMEAKEAQRKKEAEQRSINALQQQYSSSAVSSGPTTLSWGVVTPSKPSPVTTTPSPGAAWGGAAAPKKTLREIQLEEEETMRKKTLKQQQQALASKTGYSAIASAPVDDGSWTKVQPKPKQTSSSDSAPTTSRSFNDGWDVVGAPKKPVVLPAASVAPRPLVVPRKPTDPRGPSEGFKLWCKQSLKDLSPGVNAEEIYKMLLSFPADNSVGEIIQDIIYANSTSMDGRRFAAEFMKRRRLDMANSTKSLPTSVSAPAIATVEEDDSFQVVNKKGKKNKPM